MTTNKQATQDYIDFVVCFMRKQGAPAFETGADNDIRAFSCVNLTSCGKQCAVACMFTLAEAGLPNSELRDRLARTGVNREIINAALDAHDYAARHNPDQFGASFESRLFPAVRNFGYVWPGAEPEYVEPGEDHSDESVDRRSQPCASE